MSNVIDISNKIKHEPIFINLGENLMFKVDDSKNTVLELMQMWDDNKLSDIEKVDATLLKGLGKEAVDKINETFSDITFGAYQELAKAVMAAMSGVSIEEMDARFQNATSK